MLGAALITITFILLAMFKQVRSQSKIDEARPALLKLALVLLVILVFVMTLDLMNPISTERNFIVLLPLVALIVGYVTDLLTKQGQSSWWLLICIALVSGWSAVSLSKSYTLMSLVGPAAELESHSAICH